MQLRKSKTKYILVSPSSGNSEQRHIFDIAYGVLKLESINISQDDIELVIDGSNSDEIQSILTEATLKRYQIHHSKSLVRLVNSLDEYGNLVICVTGHGSMYGIEGQSCIQPEPFFDVIREQQGVKNAVIIFGQCYAGVFNYTNARARWDKQNECQISPNLIVLGATNLYESLSLPLSRKFLKNTLPWVGNVFLISVFDWFGSPVDIDGDRRFTIMDAFKYSAIWANSANKKAKGSLFKKIA